MIRRWLGRFWRDEHGVTLLTAAMMAVVLMGFAALAVDTGYLYWNQRMMQNAVDGAALAGARELIGNPDNEAGAFATAYGYAAANGVSASEIDAVTDPMYQMQVSTGFTPWGYPALRVSAERPVPPWFATLIGATDSTVRVTATAVVAPAMPNCDFWPFAIEEQFLPAYYQEVGMKMIGPTDTMGPGNFGAIRIPGSSGANDFRDNLTWGACGLTAPMEVQPETGNMRGPALQGGEACIARCGHSEYCIITDGSDPNVGRIGPHPPCPDTCRMQHQGDPGGPSVCETLHGPGDTRCSRVGIIPIIENGDWSTNGVSGTVSIKWFAIFYLTRVINDPGNPLHGTLYGFFVEEAITVGSPQYGQDVGGSQSVFLWN